MGVASFWSIDGIAAPGPSGHYCWSLASVTRLVTDCAGARGKTLGGAA